LVGVQVADMDSLTDTLHVAVKAQMDENKTTFIEVILNQELGEPFRRDAMKKPVSVAGINPSDMQNQA
jgi:sulfoacetaldehyde acetyltransferase